jgi:hypothetical protein
MDFSITVPQEHHMRITGSAVAPAPVCGCVKV